MVKLYSNLDVKKTYRNILDNICNLSQRKRQTTTKKGGKKLLQILIVFKVMYAGMSVTPISQNVDKVFFKNFAQ